MAYITALDKITGKVLWRTKPLISNAANFEIIEDTLIAGYGFTAEPDYLYLLDKKLVRSMIKSGLEFRQQTVCENL